MLKILTEGGGKIGFGHIGRCMPIYNAAKKLDIECKIYISTFGPINIPFDDNVKNVDWLKELNLVDLSSYDIVLIDTLMIDNKILTEIESITKNIFVIDDIGNNLYDRLVRVDWSVKSYVQKRPINRHLVSPSFVPLRTEFSSFPKRVIRDKARRILVTLGGSDVRNLSPSIVTFLLDNFPSLEISLLIGPGFKCIDQLEEINDVRFTALKFPNDAQIAEAMTESDLALSPGGHSIYELAASGLPTVQFMVADNQEVSRYWSEYGFTKYAGKWTDENFYEILKEKIQELLGASEREKCSLLGQKLISGTGATNLVKSIINYDLDNR